ncbi:MAG: hypothetical protein ACLRFE_02320 [Clostridia bacterium]
MLGKLLKKDLKRNMRWMWILFVSTILVAIVTRGFKELGEDILFFKVLGIFFDSVFYSLLVNVILQPFLRNFLNFSKSFYGDESYLTHTLPATKSQLITSKFITAVIEMALGFISLVVSLFIMFFSPTVFDKLRLILSLVISGKFSLFWAITLFVVLVVVEFLMFISIIYFSIVIAYRAKEKRVLKTFLLTTLMAFIAITILSIAMIIVLAINGVKLTSSTLILSSSAFMSVIITGIVVYSAISVMFYVLAKNEFSKGVNVD